MADQETPPPDEERRKDIRREEDQIEFSIWGKMGPHIKASGPFVKQLALLGSIIGSVTLGGRWIVNEIKATRMDVLETKITVQAMTEQMTPRQQEKIKLAVDQRMTLLKLAGLN